MLPKKIPFELLEDAVVLSREILEITSKVNLDNDWDTASAILRIRGKVKQFSETLDKSLNSKDGRQLFLS